VNLRHPFAILVFLIPCFASAADFLSVGKVTLMRAHSSHMTTASVRGVTAFQISAALSSHCQWLLLDPADKVSLAHLLLAQSTQATLSVRYNDSDVAPWGDTQACYVTALDQ
jgi:hypothetical protein